MPYFSRACRGRFGRCPNIVTDGQGNYCPECKPTGKKREQQRPEKVARDAIYRTARWRSYRQSFLRHNPLCAECQRNGRIVPATVVDHIVPHRGDMRLFNDMNNHQSLCERCHGTKSAQEGQNEA